MTIKLSRRTLMVSGAAMAATTGLVPLNPACAADPALPPRPEPSDWAASPDLDHVCLSPDGNHIAYIKENIDGSKLLYEYNIASKAFQTFNIGTAKIGGLFWIDATHVAVSTFATAKIEAFSGGRDTFTIVTVYNLAAKTINTLYSQFDGFRNFVAGGVNVIKQNGTTYITAATYPTNFDEFKYLYRFGLDKGLDRTLLDRAPWGTRNWVMATDGTLIARSVYYDSSKTWVLQFNQKGTWKDVYTVKSKIDYPSLIGRGPDNQSVVVYISGDGDKDGSYFLASTDGVGSTPLSIEGPESGPLFDHVTGLLCGTTSYDGWIHYHYDDPAMQTLVQKAEKAMDGYRMSIASRADDPHRMIIYTEGDDDAGTYYFVDFATGQTITIGAAYPKIPAEWLGAKQSVTYKAADGRAIEAYLTLPPNREAKNLPLVVLPHGGPVVRDGWDYDRESQAYASRGYAVLQPNYRGSAGYGDAFIVAGYGEWGRKMQTDLSDGARYLATQGIVDIKRVCIVGASYGGYAALAGVTLDPGVYRCAVDVAGLSDLRRFLDWSRDYNAANETQASQIWMRRFGGEGRLDASSPIKNIANINVPVLIVHGKDDTVVPFEQSTLMVNAMKQAGKDVTFVQYDHEDHWETNPKARGDMYRLIVDFIEKHNPPA